MTVFYVHYRVADGEIFGWGSGFDPQAVPGEAITTFAEPFDPDPATQKIDLATGEVVAKTAAETAAFRRPSLRDVAVAVFLELRRTDTFMISDYPMTGGERHQWIAYRQILRELAGDVAQRINAWPTAPDGLDPIIDLRERLGP
jgi:hypothetical protein